MSVQLGDLAPDFTQESTEGTIRFHEWLGDSWGVLFSHPADFTPVCTTELGMVAHLKGEFTKRNTKVIALSVDPLDKHKGWAKDIAETQGASLNFPLLADTKKTVGADYGILGPLGFYRRSVFVIDPAKKVRLMLTYPAPTGRNFDEILRVIDSLQLTEYQKVATPVNWKDGDDVVILPSITNEQADEMFPKGYKELKPYLRMTPQPNK